MIIDLCVYGMRRCIPDFIKVTTKYKKVTTKYKKKFILSFLIL